MKNHNYTKIPFGDKIKQVWLSSSGYLPKSVIKIDHYLDIDSITIQTAQIDIVFEVLHAISSLKLNMNKNPPITPLFQWNHTDPKL